MATDYGAATRCGDACSSCGRLHSRTTIGCGALTPFFEVAYTESHREQERRLPSSARWTHSDDRARAKAFLEVPLMPSRRGLIGR